MLMDSSNLTVSVKAFVKLNITKQNPAVITVDKRLIGMKVCQQGKEGDKIWRIGQLEHIIHMYETIK